MRQPEHSGQTRGLIPTAGAALIALALAVPSARAEPGDHLRVGAAEITPSVLMGVNWNSNVYRTAGDIGGESAPESGANFRTGPQVKIGLESSDAIMSANAAYYLRKYFNPDFSNLDNFSEVDVGLDLNLLPKSVVGFKTRDSVRRRFYPTEATAADNALLSRTTTNVSGFLSVHPGQALDVDLGGWFTYDAYQVPTTAVDTDLNNKREFGPRAELKWTFFPKTAFVADFQYGLIRWENTSLDGSGGTLTQSTEYAGDSIAIPNANYWKLRTGLVGRFTQRLVLNLIAGYGQSLYDETSVTTEATDGVNDFSQDVTGVQGILAGAGLEWNPIGAHTITVGYTKDFDDSWFTNYVAFHNIYGRYRTLVASQFGLYGEVSYRYESYAGQVTRNDNVMRARAGASYAATGWLEADFNLNWTRRNSADEPALSSVEWDDFQLGAQLTFSY